MAKTLSSFKLKHVQGLYSYDHFEAEDGSFMQRRHGPKIELVYQDAAGDRFHFSSIQDLAAHLAKEAA